MVALLAGIGCMLAGQAGCDSTLRRHVGDDMQQVTKSLDELLNELAIIKREATGRLSSVKSRLTQGAADPDKIRQTKVSKFVLKRVAELELESQSMRDELAKLAAVQKEQRLLAGARQEDHDFADDSQTQAPSSSTTQQGMPSTGEPTTTDSSKIGFDVEALKRLGEEIGKRLDQFGREAVKNLGDLVEGVKLVFREPPVRPASNSSSGGTSSPRLDRLSFIIEI